MIKAEIACKNCRYCDVITGNDMCKRLKCTATPRTKTISWHMLSFSEDGTATNLYAYFAEELEKHKTPNWCPLLKNHTDGTIEYDHYKYE